MKSEDGFTLLELLVAITIFALMSAMAYSGLNVALNTREHADVQSERLAKLQKAMSIIGRDIEQTIDRPIRDNYASELPPISGGGYGSAVLELTRSGRRNPMGQARSSMQRVGYQLAEGRLLRQSWLALDRALDSEPMEAVLLTDVKAVEMRFMDLDHEWLPQWPDQNSGNTAPPELPRAVEVTLDLEDWGRIRRVFEVVG